MIFVACVHGLEESHVALDVIVGGNPGDIFCGEDIRKFLSLIRSDSAPVEEAGSLPVEFVWIHSRAGS